MAEPEIVLTPRRRLGTLTWEPRRGGSSMQRGPLPELAKKLCRLRCPAELRADDLDEPIGRTWERQPSDGCDNPRVKWLWWYDATACE